MCNVPLLAFKALMIKMHCNAFGYGFFRCEVGDTRLSARTGEVIKKNPQDRRFTGSPYSYRFNPTVPSIADLVFT